MTLKGRKEKMNEGRNEEDIQEGKRRQEERKTGKKEESQKVRKGERKISKCKFYEKHVTAK